MSSETLELRLKAFRLPAFLSHYAPLAEQAAQQKAAAGPQKRVSLTDQQLTRSAAGPATTKRSAGPGMIRSLAASAGTRFSAACAGVPSSRRPFLNSNTKPGCVFSLGSNARS